MKIVFWIILLLIYTPFAIGMFIGGASCLSNGGCGGEIGFWLLNFILSIPYLLFLYVLLAQPDQKQADPNHFSSAGKPSEKINWMKLFSAFLLAFIGLTIFFQFF